MSRFFSGGNSSYMKEVCASRMVLFVLFCLLTAFGSIAQPIKAISFNIRMATESDKNNQWALRKASVVDFLKYEEADFIGMQEVLLAQLNELKTGLKSFRSIGVARDDGKEKGEFSPIFYHSKKWKLLDSGTFWLSETPETPSKSWDAALPRICTWGRFKSKESRKEIVVFNTHFDHVGKDARANSAQLIVDRIAEMTKFESTLLLGDFNAEESAQPILNITNSPLLDAYAQSEIRYGEVGTFNAFDYSRIPTRRIDYVFNSKDLKVRKYSLDSSVIDGRYLSDHFPVIVQLELK